MDTTATLCCRCKKDVSNTKRVKDPRGNFYCESCYQAAVKQQQQQRAAQQPGRAPAAPPPPPTPGARVGTVPTAAAPRRMPPPPPPSRQSAPPPPPPRPAAAAPSAPSQKPLPDRCPACDAIMLPGRRICIKCNRDVTKLDKLLEVRARNAHVSSEEKVGEWISKAIKAVFILVVVGACVFMGWGAWIMFHPGKPFDDYPTKRIDAVKQIVANISEGSEKSYEAAFKLITLHVRTTDNVHQDLVYKMVFKHMHDDFIQKYGADWLTKAKIESEDPSSNDEIVPFTLSIDDDVYHILSQAQVAGGVSTFENNLLHGHQEYPETGERHFGIYEIYEYTVRSKDKDEPKGPSKLQHLDDLQPLDKTAPADNNAPKPDPNAPPAP